MRNLGGRKAAVLLAAALAVAAGTARAQTPVGRMSVLAGDGWQAKSLGAAASLPLQGSGLASQLPSETRLFHLPGGKEGDRIILVLRASTHAAPVQVAWTADCNASRNLDARLLAPGTQAPDCLKLSGLVRSAEFAGRALPAVAQAAAAGDVVLPATSRYFSFLVTGPNGGFVSGAGLASSAVQDLPSWAEALAAAARDAVGSLSGNLRIPEVDTQVHR